MLATSWLILLEFSRQAIRKSSSSNARKGKNNAIITGDFNYNLFNVKHHEETETFYSEMITNSYKPLITKPTRVTDNSSTLIDHIWTNDMSYDKIESKVLITDITDHLPVIHIK